jgi:hypothetical protein
VGGFNSAAGGVGMIKYFCDECGKEYKKKPPGGDCDYAVEKGKYRFEIEVCTTKKKGKKYAWYPGFELCKPCIKKAVKTVLR